MDTLYSLSLLLSLVAGGLAVLLSILARFPRLYPSSLRNTVNRLHALGASIFLATAALGVSLAVHLTSGHRPGSAEALPFPEFFRIHPSYIVAALLPVLAATFYRLLRHRGHDGSDSDPDA